ncbi:MAG: AraC family transcriptional regulator [Elainellaceae cyanobacterium]
MERQSVVGERRTYADRADTHDHPFAQLILPLNGTLFISTALEQLELTESRLFFLPPQCQHTFYAKDSNEFLVLDIPSFLIAERDLQPVPNGLSLVLDDRWQAIRQLLLTEITDSAIAAPHLMPLVHYVCGLLRQNHTPRSLQFLHSHYHEAIDLKTLATLEGYSLTYYCDWFRRQTGMSPKAYIQQLRLQKAKELLQHSNFSVWQIARQVGYEQPASLTRLFQQHERQTPLAYRQQYRKD